MLQSISNVLHFSQFLLALMMIVMVSCNPLEIGEIGSLSAEGTRSSVRILTRSDSGEPLSYPLHVYGFSENGRLIAHQQLVSPDDPLMLSLPQAEGCHILVLSAGDGIYQLPSSPVLSSIITMNPPVLADGISDFAQNIAQGFVTSSPLQIGAADVFPQSDKATVSIQMHYQVASLSVALHGIPESCTSVFLNVASPFNGVSLDGQANGSLTARIPLSQKDGRVDEWGTSSPVYLFPTSGSTTFTIAYNDEEGEQYSSISYLAPLLAGTPYQLRGTYSDRAFQISGNITPSMWKDVVALDFVFNPSSSTTIDDDSPEPDSDNENTSQLPPLFTLYNGHLVVGYLDAEGTPQSSSSSSLLLLSLTDWSDLTSALHESTPTAAADMAETYYEYDLADGWRIPTEAEARYLSKLYRDDPDLFDQAISDAHGDPIVLTDDKGNNLRYLCSDAVKTYSYKTSTITKAGTTIKNYHLRLVRTQPIQ